VGSGADQLHHLSEIRRVLKPGGWCYLATPNRWTIIEPHFKLPFLSWLPGRWPSAYVRLVRRGSVYDCNVLARRQLRALFRSVGLEAHDRTIDAMRVMADVESKSGATRVALTAPEPLIRLAYPILPTLVFVLRRPADRGNTLVQ
jgi:SAM-dependent methyltransferase